MEFPPFFNGHWQSPCTTSNCRPVLLGSPYGGPAVGTPRRLWKSLGQHSLTYLDLVECKCTWYNVPLDISPNPFMLEGYHGHFVHSKIVYLILNLENVELRCTIWLVFVLQIIFSCDQAALQMVFSVRPSVCPSVTPFSPCSHHRIIMKFSGVITMVKSDVHAKGQGQRSKVKVTEVNTQLSRFRTVTPVWIHIWQWNDAYSLMMLRRGALLFLKVIRQISRSHSSKKRRIWPRLGVSGL